MLSLSCVDPWPEGSVSLEEEVVTAAAQAEHLDLQDPGCEPCPPSQPSPSQPSPSQPSPSQALSSAPSTGGSLCLDDSLTSLQWLQEFSILSANGPRPPPLSTHPQPHLFGHHQQLLGPEAPASPLAGDPASMGMPLTPGKPTAAAYTRMQSFSALPGLVAHGHCPDEVDYKTNAHIKPPYSYATLICMAMQASKKSKITLSCIYKWITDNFCYFRHADPTWQNSIRHNLSLNKCFIKVPRQKDEPGKGGFWKIDPQYAERLLNGAYKKRRMPPVQINPALQNRLQGALAQPRPQLQPRGPGSPMLGQGGELCVDPESQQLLQEFEEATGADQNWDPRQAHRPMLGGWPAGRGLGGGGGKRKQSSRTGGAKAPRRSSSPLLSLEEQRELGPLKGSFDWDALLDSALSGELSLDGMEPLSPIPLQDQDQDQDLTVRGTHICPLQAPGGVAEDNHVLMETQRRCGGGGGGGGDYDEETFLATAFLQSPWQEEEGRADFLCSSTVNLDQLFDLGEPLGGGGDISIKIESLL